MLGGRQDNNNQVPKGNLDNKLQQEDSLEDFSIPSNLKLLLDRSQLPQEIRDDLLDLNRDNNLHHQDNKVRVGQSQYHIGHVLSLVLPSQQLQLLAVSMAFLFSCLPVSIVNCRRRSCPPCFFYASTASAAAAQLS